MAHKLYILMRKDMESMVPGRACAQASHATSMFQRIYSDTEAYSDWASETPCGFGTVIVLETFRLEEDFEHIRRNFMHEFPENEFIAGIVVDPEYPLKDGRVTHILKDVPTCAFFLLTEEQQTDDMQNYIEGLWNLY